MSKETHIGRALRWYLSTQGISLRQLSKGTGIPHASLHRFLKDGDSMNVQNYLKLMTWANSAIDPPITEKS